MTAPSNPGDMHAHVEAMQESTRVAVHAIGQHLTIILAEAQFLRKHHGNINELHAGLDQIVNATYEIVQKMKVLHDTVTHPLPMCEYVADPEPVVYRDL